MSKVMLDLYSDYLLCSFGVATATGLSNAVGGAVSHDQVTRFLSDEVKTSADLWHVVKPMVREIESDAGVVSIDDCIVEKPYTDENEIIAWHYDHTQGRAVKGINFMTTLYSSQGYNLPVAFAVVAKTETYTDAKSGVEKRRSPTSKNEYYREMLQACVRNQIRFRYVLNDSWYSAAENMRFVHTTLKRDFVMALKSNRKVALSAQDKRAGHYQTLNTLSLPEGSVWEIYLGSVDFPLLLAQQLFTNEDGNIGILYLVTSDMELDWPAMTTLYQTRWKIEEYHRSLKQNAALADSPTRTQTTQTNHLFAALCAFIKLEGLRMHHALNHYALKSRLHLAAIMHALKTLETLLPVRLDPLLA